MNLENSWRKLAPGQLIASFLFFVVITPILGMSIINRVIECTTQTRLDKVQRLTQDTDEMINKGELSEILSEGVSYLEREFYQGEELLARDTLWPKEDKYQLTTREYFEDGRIVERGTHAELLAREGVYHQLYEAQFEQKSAIHE